MHWGDDVSANISTTGIVGECHQRRHTPRWVQQRRSFYEQYGGPRNIIRMSQDEDVIRRACKIYSVDTETLMR